MGNKTIQPYSENELRNMREALSAAKVDHIDKSVSEAIAALAADRDALLEMLREMQNDSAQQALDDAVWNPQLIEVLEAHGIDRAFK